MVYIYLHENFWTDFFFWVTVILLIIGLVYFIFQMLFRGHARASALESHRRSEIAWSEMGILAHRKAALWTEYELGRITLEEHTKIVEPINHAYQEAEAEWIRAAHPERDIKERK